MNGRFWGWACFLAVAVAGLQSLSPSVAFAQRDDGFVRRDSGAAKPDDSGIRSSYDDRRNRGPKPAISRNQAGDFDYYALVLSWSPTHCSEEEGADDVQQCARQDGKRFAFIVHGLWPQYDSGYPQNCARTGSSYIPDQVIDRMMDIMPSKRLIIHEYRKHGTCSGLAPFAYYEFVRRLFAGIKIPDRYINPFESQFVTPSDLVSHFLAVNPKLSREMIAISCGGAGRRLREIRICMTKSGETTACGSNENQRRLCNATSMFVPPVRSSRVGDETYEIRQKSRPLSPLPMPTVQPWKE